MIKQLRMVVGGAVALWLVGCAHPIQLSPDLQTLRSQATDAPKIEQTVGYYISSEDMAKKVITGGGGGDQVEYAPYADTDVAIFTSLSNVFTDVQKIAAFTKGQPPADGMALVLVPSIVTSSSSDSMLTWPPTDFSYTLTCKAYDNTGQEIWQETVTGTGNAEFEEFSNDFSLSARRAVADAMPKLEAAIRSRVAQGK